MSINKTQDSQIIRKKTQQLKKSDKGSSPASLSKTESEEIKRKISNLEFSISKSVRYTGKRKCFFDKLHNISIAIIALLGSGGFLSILTDNNTPYLCSIIRKVIYN